MPEEPFSHRSSAWGWAKNAVKNDPLSSGFRKDQWELMKLHGLTVVVSFDSCFA